jgi:soluble lytic murein transglycosylase-like protein
MESAGFMSRRRAPLAAGLCLALTLSLTAIAAAATKTVVRATPGAIAAYSTVLRQYNPRMPIWQSNDLAKHLLIAAAHNRLDPSMLAAIVSVESDWHTHAVSYAGAVGLGQLMPGTAATLGVNPRDPKANLSGAARYLRGLLEKFGRNPNRYALVFAAYNAGPKAVIRYGGVPPYYETQHYVVKVLRAWHELKSVVHVPENALRPVLALQDPDEQYWLGDKH